MAGLAFHDFSDAGRTHQVGEAVARQDQRAILFELLLIDVDEVVVLGIVGLGADVTENLVAPRMAHRLELRQATGGLAFSDRGVVAGDQSDRPTVDLVEAGVSDMTGGEPTVFDQGNGDDAGHVVQAGILKGLLIDRVVGQGDGFTHPAGGVRDGGGQGS